MHTVSIHFKPIFAKPSDIIVKPGYIKVAIQICIEHQTQHNNL